MFDPRQRQGQPMPQRPAWAQQLGQGLAAQQPQWGQPMPQGGPPPGVRFAPQGGAVAPQAMGPEQRPMVPPGSRFLQDSDAAIRAALARSRGGRMPVMPEGAPPPGAQPQAAPEPDADERGGAPDGDQDDPRARMGGYR